MSALVTLGNTNAGTFENVCHAVQFTYPDDVDTLLVFDSPESLNQNPESTRNEHVRRVFRGVKVCSQLVAEAELQTVIPLAVARLIREFGSRGLIIDLTNGRKKGTSVLYAVASISRIERIHSLEVKDRSVLGRPLTELRNPDQWEYITLEPLKEIDAVAQHSYLELLYYHDAIEAATTAAHGPESEFAQDARRWLTQAVEDYFAGGADQLRYAVSVATAGLLCERTAKLLSDHCQQWRKGRAEATDFAGYVNQVRSLFEQLRTRKMDWDQAGDLKPLAQLLPADVILDAARVMRNLTHHPNGYRCLREDARLMLDIGLWILRRLGEARIVQSM